MFKTKALSKRQKVARAFKLFKIFDIAKLGVAQQIFIFNFHRISESPIVQTCFDDSLFGPDVETFRAHMKSLAKNADPISEKDLLDFSLNGKKLPKRSFMITFDDGYKDNYDLAFPVLKELGLPAMFFVPTQAVEERRLGWWDLINWCLKTTNKKTIHILNKNLFIEKPFLHLSETFTQLIKTNPQIKPYTLVAELAKACEVELPSKEICSAELMTWEDLKTVQKHNIAIGSHTHTHRVLSCLSLEEQRNELTKSKQILESKLNSPIHSIAYPVGGYEHFHDQTMNVAKECGYQFAFSFLTGSNHLNELNHFDIKRIDRQLDEPTYAGVFAMPWLFAKRSCSLKKPMPYLAERYK